MEKLNTFCAPGGRAGKRGCSIGTNAHDPNQRVLVGRYNDALKGVVSSCATPTLCLVDLFHPGQFSPV